MKSNLWFILLPTIFVISCNRPSFVQPYKIITLHTPELTLSDGQVSRPIVTQDEVGNVCVFRFLPTGNILKLYIVDTSLKSYDSFTISNIADRTYNSYKYKHNVYLSSLNTIRKVSLEKKYEITLHPKHKPDSFGNFNYWNEAFNYITDSTIYLATTSYMVGQPYSDYFISEFTISDSGLIFKKYLFPVFDDFKHGNYRDNKIFDVNDNVLYGCLQFYNKVFAFDTKTGQPVFTIDISDDLRGYKGHQLDKDSAKDIQYLKSFFITKPQIATLRYDKYRNYLHLLIKKEQPLADNDGMVNDRYSAGYYWLIYDKKGKLLKRYDLPPDIYQPVMLFRKNDILIKRNEKDDNKIVFGAFIIS